MDSALGLGGGDALDSVDAGLVFQMAENLVAGDFQDDFLETADFRGRTFKVLGLPAFGVGITLVEAHDFAGEERGFVAARARAYFDECVSVFVGIGGEEGVLHVLAQLLQRFFQLRDLLGGHFGKLLVIGSCQLLVVGELRFGGLERVPKFECLLELAVLAQDFAGSFLVRKKIRIANGFLEFAEAVFAFGDELGVIHGVNFNAMHGIRNGCLRGENPSVIFPGSPAFAADVWGGYFAWILGGCAWIPKWLHIQWIGMINTH